LYRGVHDQQGVYTMQEAGRVGPNTALIISPAKANTQKLTNTTCYYTRCVKFIAVDMGHGSLNFRNFCYQRRSLGFRIPVQSRSPRLFTAGRCWYIS
jgi:hypothetical protein